MQAWKNNLLATDLVSKTVADDFEEKFGDFYLTNTYLAGNSNAPAPSCGVSSCSKVLCYNYTLAFGFYTRLIASL